MTTTKDIEELEALDIATDAIKEQAKWPMNWERTYYAYCKESVMKYHFQSAGVR